MKIGTVEEAIDKSVELFGNLDETLKAFEKRLQTDIDHPTHNSASHADNAYEVQQIIRKERKEIEQAIRHLEMARGRVRAMVKLLA